MAHIIRVFKHAHRGLEVFNELEDLINHSDLVLPEIAILRHEETKRKTARYREMLDGRVTPDVYLSQEVLTEDPYSRRLFGLLVDAKKPMIPLESISKEKSIVMHQKHEDSRNSLFESFDALKYGRLKKALKGLARYVRIMNGLSDERDRNMAQRMENIGDTIKSEYPSLEGSLKVLATVGYKHNPEKYFRSSASVNLEVIESKIRNPDDIDLSSENPEDLAKVLLDYALNSAMRSSFHTTSESYAIREILLPQFSARVLENLCNHLIPCDPRQFGTSCYTFFRDNYNIK